MMTDGIASLITTLSMNGSSSVLKRCSPTAPARWAFAAIAALLLNARTHAFFVKPVNPKPAVPVGSKAPNNGSHSSTIFCQTANDNISPSRYPTYFGLSSTIIGLCSTDSFAAPRVPCSNMPSVLG